MAVHWFTEKDIVITLDDSIKEKLDYLVDICHFKNYDEAFAQIIIYTFDVFGCLEKYTKDPAFVQALKDKAKELE